MDYCKGRVTKLLVDYFENDFRRINHALNVLKEAENLLKEYNSFNYEIIIATALLHDVGIKRSEEELGYNNGKTQERYGPSIAKELLLSINFPRDKIKTVTDIIGNHHSPSKYEYVELEILKRADNIVNREENIVL
jgi:HD superfamily phosphodiesterase